MDYKNAYLLLFRSTTQAINELEKALAVTKDVAKGIAILKEAQQKAEDMYIESESY